MCDAETANKRPGTKTIPVQEAVGTVLAHDITEIRPGEFKGRAFKRGHVVRKEDICHLRRLGKDHLFVLNLAEDEMHEDDAALAFANALMGSGVAIEGEPKEGKINIIAQADGLLKIQKDALLEFNLLGDAMCATLHNNTVVKKGQKIAEFDDAPIRQAVKEQELGLGLLRNGTLDEEARLKLALIGVQREQLTVESAADQAEWDLKNLAAAEAQLRRLLDVRIKQADSALQRAKARTDKKPEEDSKPTVEEAALQREIAAADLERFSAGEAWRKRQAQRRLADAGPPRRAGQRLGC